MPRAKKSKNSGFTWVHAPLEDKSHFLLKIWAMNQGIPVGTLAALFLKDAISVMADKLKAEGIDVLDVFKMPGGSK